MSEATSDDDPDVEGSKYLTFTIGSVCYGLDIRTVTTIIGLQAITPIPDVPNYVKGVINLRGRVIPVIDMRVRFRLEHRAYHDRTCIIVIEVGCAIAGLVVDAISEVLGIPDEDIELPPTMGLASDNRFVSGVGKVGNDVKVLLDARVLIDVDRQPPATETVVKDS